jgi:hypothetical protein
MSHENVARMSDKNKHDHHCAARIVMRINTLLRLTAQPLMWLCVPKNLCLEVGVGEVPTNADLAGFPRRGRNTQSSSRLHDYEVRS